MNDWQRLTRSPKEAERAFEKQMNDFIEWTKYSVQILLHPEIPLETNIFKIHNVLDEIFMTSKIIDYWLNQWRNPQAAGSLVVLSAVDLTTNTTH